MATSGKVYKIIFNESNVCYIGSTFNRLSDRLRQHKQKYKCKREENVAVYDLFDQYGVDNCLIVLIKTYEVLDRCHLHVYEQLWINKLKSVNKNNPMGRIISKKQYKKQYHEANREQILEKKKQYYLTNREIIEEKRSVKITCECETIISKSSLSTH